MCVLSIVIVINLKNMQVDNHVSQQQSHRQCSNKAAKCRIAQTMPHGIQILRFSDAKNMCEIRKIDMCGSCFNQ